MLAVSIGPTFRMQRAEIRGVSFGLLTDESLASRSVLALSCRKQAAKSSIDTLSDPRMGTISPEDVCTTCALPPDRCPGHVGHIELCEPVLSAHFLPIIDKVLNCICVACASLLVELDDDRVATLLDRPPKTRLTELNKRALAARSPCPACGQAQPLYWTVCDGILVRPVWPHGIEAPTVTPDHLSGLMRLIDERTARLLGFGVESAPHSVFRKSFPVPPPLMRPDRAHKMEDDLTTRLKSIIQASDQLKATKQETNLSKCEHGELFVQQSQWRPRHQRTGMTLVPEHLERYFELQRQCAGFQDAKYCPKNDLDYGRELTSVRHRFSTTRHKRGRVRANILGKRGDFTARAVASPNTYIDPHEVGVPIGVCMRLTMAERVCTFNFQRLQAMFLRGPDDYPGANFVERDGTRYKLPIFQGGLRLGDVVHRHLQRGDVVIMNRQPSLHRYSMMGYSVVPVAAKTFQLHLSVTTAHNLDFDGDEVNMFVPGSLQAVAEIQELMAVPHNLFKDGSLLVGFVQHACLGAYLLAHNNVRFDDADLQQLWAESGMIDMMGVPAHRDGKSILRALLPTYDGTSTVTKSLMNKLAYRFLARSGMSALRQCQWIGAVVRFLEATLLVVGSTIGHTDCTSTEKDTGLIRTGMELMRQDTDERRVVTLSDTVRDAVGSIVRSDLEARARNHLLDITDSGAKGNRSHVVQNVAMVGQQFDDMSRRHPRLGSHCAREAELRGFVTSSFTDGLGPIEYFHHLRSSRIGLVATAISTAETGYCYRRIAKCLEDLRVAFDHSIRDARDAIVTISAGFDTSKLYRTDIPLLTADIRASYTGDEDELEHLESIRREYTTMYPLCTSVFLPFDMSQLPRATGLGEPRVSATEAKGAVRALWDRLCQRYVPRWMRVVVFDWLASWRILEQYRVRTPGQLRDIIDCVERGLCRGLYQPGTPIGLIASQSFSEPLTQMQLNHFHHSGEGSGLVSGVTRIKEIINCVRSIQTPSMLIVPRAGMSVGLGELVETTFQDVMVSWSAATTGRLDIILDRDAMIRRHITPRIVADALVALYPGVRHTTELPAARWLVWIPFEGTPIEARDLVHGLRSKNPLVSGIPGIRDFYETTRTLTVTDGDGRVAEETRACVATLGSNLEHVCALPWVDVAHTSTNDLLEIFRVYGIDAYRAAVEEQLAAVLTSNSATVSRCYIRLIACQMCVTGTPCPLTFHGLAQGNTSTLKLATFERSLNSFVQAACEGHEDALRGISEATIVGKPVSVGTGGDFTVLAADGYRPDADGCTQIVSDKAVYPPVPMDIDCIPHLPVVDELQLPTPAVPGQPRKAVQGAKRRKLSNPYLDADGKFPGSGTAC